MEGLLLTGPTPSSLMAAPLLICFIVHFPVLVLIGLLVSCIASLSSCYSSNNAELPRRKLRSVGLRGLRALIKHPKKV